MRRRKTIRREKLTEYEALRAYAKMLNTLSVKPLEPLLAGDFTYESQWVFSPLSSKRDFLNYIRPKLETIRNTGATVFAEMGGVFVCGRQRPCVVLAQYTKGNLIGVVLASISANRLNRLDLCAVPRPQAAKRSGEYPT